MGQQCVERKLLHRADYQLCRAQLMTRTISHHPAPDNSGKPQPVRSDRELKTRHPMRVTVLPAVKKHTKKGWVVLDRVQLDPQITPTSPVSRKKQLSEEHVKSLI